MTRISATALPHSPLQWRRVTPRELRVLELEAEGLTADEAAARLGITVATVYDHHCNLKLKVAARSMAHAVALAYQDGALA